MRVLAGIMYTIENELSKCLESVINQTNVKVDYFLIDNLPEKEAHDLLYSTFMERHNNYDFFVKVDADMIIRENNLFFSIGKIFSQQSYNMISVPVYDFFTKRYLNGMHFFRNNTKWQRFENGNKLFTDDSPIKNKEEYLYLKNTKVVDHCPYPSLTQSIHFGVHRALKLSSAYRDEKRKMQGYTHYRNLIRVIFFSLVNKKNNYFGVIYGIYGVQKNIITIETKDYKSPIFVNFVKVYNKADKKKIWIQAFYFVLKHYKYNFLFFKKYVNHFKMRIK